MYIYFYNIHKIQLHTIKYNKNTYGIKQHVITPMPVVPRGACEAEALRETIPMYQTPILTRVVLTVADVM